MCLRLQNSNLSVIHMPGKEMFLADMLSCAHSQSVNHDDLYDINLGVALIDVADAELKEMVEATTHDEMCQLLCTQNTHGWLASKDGVPDMLKPYYIHREEFTVDEGVILKGNRILIPMLQRKSVLDQVHEAHIGVVKTKQLTCASLYWPGMSTQIEDMVHGCSICQEYRKINPAEPQVNHNIPDIPYYKVGAYLFEVKVQMYLITLDYY